MELTPNNCHLTKGRVREHINRPNTTALKPTLSVWRICFPVIKPDLYILKPNLSKLDLCLASLVCCQAFLLGISAFTNKSRNFRFSSIGPLYKHAVMGLIAKANRSVPWPFYFPIFPSSAKIQSRANSLERHPCFLCPIHSVYSCRVHSHELVTAPARRKQTSLSLHLGSSECKRFPEQWSPSLTLKPWCLLPSKQKPFSVLNKDIIRKAVITKM